MTNKHEMLKRNTNKIWYKHKVHKEATFPRSIIHRAVVMNKCRGWILAKVGKSCFYCGLSVVESMDHRFFNCPLASQVCCYEVNIIGQLYAKRDNGGPRKLFSTMHCLCDQPLSKSWKPFNRIWFFLRNGRPWIIWCQHNDQVEMLFQGQWQKYTKLCGIPYLIVIDLSGNKLSWIWKKHWMLLMRMFLTNLTIFGMSKVLLLLVAILCLLGKLGPDGHSFLKSHFSLEVVVLFLLQMNFLSICAKKGKKTNS